MLKHVERSSDPLESFIGTQAERQKIAKRSKPHPGQRRKQQIAEIERRIAAKDWDGMTSGLLVALYWTCHRKTYGVEPAELNTASTWTKAMKSAGKLVIDQFDGDVDLAIKFMRWLWTREQSREQWASKNGIDRSRITWIRQFCRVENVSDWRADKVRRER